MKPHKSHETHKRTLAKSITWRVAATIITFVIVIIFTGRMDWAISLSILDMILKFIGYYVHERAWDRVDWGILSAKPKLNK
jgi:adenylylsulfate kinase